MEWRSGLAWGLRARASRLPLFACFATLLRRPLAALVTVAFAHLCRPLAALVTVAFAHLRPLAALVQWPSPCAGHWRRW